jgi:YHS domain-containing protein
VTEEIFKAFSLIPHRHMDLMAMKHFGWNSTTILDAIALLAAGVIYWLYKSQDQDNADSEYAKDLVCGMQVRKADAPAVAELDGVTYYFCMVGCKEALLANPEKYISSSSVG